MSVKDCLLTLNELEEQVKALKAKPLPPSGHRTIVLMNGTFDLLHPGHVQRLHRGAEQGWHLIVAVDSDELVTELKGPGRPIRPWEDRALTVAAVCGVWRVTRHGAGVLMAHIMDAVEPNMYVVRSHGSGDERAKADVAQALHRKIPVLILPDHGEWSTTDDIKHIRGVIGAGSLSGETVFDG